MKLPWIGGGGESGKEAEEVDKSQIIQYFVKTRVKLLKDFSN